MVKVEKVKYRVGGHAECDSCAVGTPVLFRVNFPTYESYPNELCVDCLAMLVSEATIALASYFSAKQGQDQ